MHCVAKFPFYGEPQSCPFLCLVLGIHLKDGRAPAVSDSTEVLCALGPLVRSGDLR